jgi:hypothetical protein
MDVKASQAIIGKLGVLGITLGEIEESLFNLQLPMIEETRMEHRTEPPTYWFVSETAMDRVLFVVGLWDREREVFIVKTSRDATDKDLERWENGKR